MRSTWQRSASIGSLHNSWHSSAPISVSSILPTLSKHRVYSTTSYFPYYITPRMGDAVDIMEESFGKALITTNGKVAYCFDFDGTTGHTKEAHHISYTYTHKEFFGEEPDHDENTTMHKVDGDPKVVFPQYFGENGEKAFKTFSIHMDEHYPATVTPMPGVQRFLTAMDTPRKHGLAKTAIVSFMDHNRLNRAVDAIGFRKFFDTIEGTKGNGDDKTTPEMFTKRVYPALFGGEDDFMKRYAAWAEKEYGLFHEIILGNHTHLIRVLKPAVWPEGLVAVLHFGDSRSSDNETAKSIPNGLGTFIAYNKGKPGTPADKVETEHPHIPDWIKGKDMYLTAAIQAVDKHQGRTRFSREEEATLRKELWALREENRKQAGWAVSF